MTRIIQPTAHLVQPGRRSTRLGEVDRGSEPVAHPGATPLRGLRAWRFAKGHPGGASVMTESTPQPAQDEVVKVVRAHDQAEAEFLQGLLAAEGVPSGVRRAPGFDVPDFLAAGPRDLLVVAAQVQTARDALLLDADPDPAPPPSSRVLDRYPRVLVFGLVGVALVAIVAW